MPGANKGNAMQKDIPGINPTGEGNAVFFFTWDPRVFQI